MKTFTPTKCPGLEIPLCKVNGNDYMKVAHRLLWLVNEVKSYDIETVFIEKTADSATCRASITLFDENGKASRRATAHKTEDVKGFKDFAEKAETGAVGRALASLGFGTAQAISDLDEGQRIVDAPLETPGQQQPVTQAASLLPSTAPTGTVSSFRKRKPAPAQSNVVAMPQAATTNQNTQAVADGWNSESEWK